MTEEGNTGLTWEHRLALWLPRPLLFGAFLIAVCIGAAYLSFQWFLDLRVEPSTFGAVVFIAASLMAPRYFLAPSAHFSAVTLSDPHETEVQALHVSLDKIRRSRLAARFAYFHFAGLYAPAGPKKSDIDLLNLDKVYAFGSSGLHGSLPWFVILAVGYLLILPRLGNGLWVMLSLSAINLWWPLCFSLRLLMRYGA